MTHFRFIVVNKRGNAPVLFGKKAVDFLRAELKKCRPNYTFNFRSDEDWRLATGLLRASASTVTRNHSVYAYKERRGCPFPRSQYKQMLHKYAIPFRRKKYPAFALGHIPHAHAGSYTVSGSVPVSGSITPTAASNDWSHDFLYIPNHAPIPYRTVRLPNGQVRYTFPFHGSSRTVTTVGTSFQQVYEHCEQQYQENQLNPQSQQSQQQSPFLGTVGSSINFFTPPQQVSQGWAPSPAAPVPSITHNTEAALTAVYELYSEHNDEANEDPD